MHRTWIREFVKDYRPESLPSYKPDSGRDSDKDVVLSAERDDDLLPVTPEFVADEAAPF